MKACISRTVYEYLRKFMSMEELDSMVYVYPDKVKFDVDD